MTEIPFYKMSGSGNDFIIIDNREATLEIDDIPGWVAKVCRRGLSVGADGLILVEPSDSVDFKWQFFNADGSSAEMCGNGARCVSRFAHLNGITGEELCFETIAGIISAHVRGDQVRIKMSAPTDLVVEDSVEVAGYPLPISHVNTGVPHVVMEVKDLPGTNVKAVGQTLRYHPNFEPAGTNVNFIAPVEKDIWGIRTYERGVENETLACGTGNVAAAIVLALKYQMTSPVTFRTLSGSHLRIFFNQDGEKFDEVYLEGDARVIYTGRINPEAWQF